MKQIYDYFTKEFHKIFSSSELVVGNSLHDLVEPCVLEMENARLINTFMEKEIREVVSSMNLLQAFGLDGFSRAFYKKLMVYHQETSNSICV